MLCPRHHKFLERHGSSSVVDGQNERRHGNLVVLRDGDDGRPHRAELDDVVAPRVIGLFDVHADPMELTNLADDPKHAAVRAELSKLVNTYSYPA